ncbi:hypothetical protein [Nocardia paucivorans]|uniref:hypothetical protein n=1 Tax=Nocardia paucivorans TaxID=114259 RepID=UPI000305BEC3|nr:hypothetical protein [Nocardia paucivorans]
MKFDLAVHPEIGPSAPGSPHHLVITDTLPDVCARHGREAVEHREGQMTFYTTRRGGKQVTLVRLLGKLLQIWRLTVVEHTRPDIVLHGEWPVCPSCLRPGRIYRRVATALIGLAALSVVVMILLLLQGIRPPKWTMFVFLPGWIPIGLLVIMRLFQAGEVFVRAEISPDMRQVDIEAHERFAAAAVRLPE